MKGGVGACGKYRDACSAIRRPSDPVPYSFAAKCENGYDVDGISEEVAPRPSVMTMSIIRPMRASDVAAAHMIRTHVHENRLSDPSLVRESDYHDFLARRTLSWIYEQGGTLAGFCMVDLEKQNLWALFVATALEGKGVGRALHDEMLVRYFEQCDHLKLSTGPNTRASGFYRAAGYTLEGPSSDGKELIYTLSKAAWLAGRTQDQAASAT